MGIFDKIVKWSNKIIDPLDLAEKSKNKIMEGAGIPSAKEKRSQAQMMREQIEAYRKQTELTEKQLNDTRAEKATEKRRIEEKQIRGLRNSYRSAGGFLNNQKPTLGNEAILPNKLGTV